MIGTNLLLRKAHFYRVIIRQILFATACQLGIEIGGLTYPPTIAL
jgi:hypothetical protein